MPDNTHHESGIGRSIERWRDRYRLRMYPELRGLSREDAKTALQIATDDIHSFDVQHVWGWMLTFLILLGLMFVFMSGLVDELLARWGLSWKWFGLSLFAVNCGLVPWIFRRHVIRKYLRRYVNEKLDYGHLRLCSECAYDLRASYGDSCPECGAAIPKATQRWIRHQIIRDEP